MPSSASTVVSLYRYADDVRSLNDELDKSLRKCWAMIPSWRLHDQDQHARRTVAEQLGHLAESCNFLADQVDDWLAGRRAVMGRCAPEDADFQDALARAADLDMATLHTELELAFRRLGAVLSTLDDVHLRATVHHVKHGREPLSLLLVRDVLAHKSRHADELWASADIFGSGG